MMRAWDEVEGGGGAVETKGPLCYVISMTRMLNHNLPLASAPRGAAVYAYFYWFR